MTLRLNIVRWLVTLVGVQFLCAIAWVIGPLLPWLEPVPVRLVVVLLGLLAWAIGNAAVDWRRTRREAVLTLGLTGAAQDEAAAVQERLTQALALLRRAKGRRFALSEQPWYAIIGPPGAGKTTALMNSGLSFPLAGELGPGAVSGVGGTRLCEWWFTDDAVLIDTAGRYTTQDSDKAVDGAGWRAFLGLVRAARPKQPLNGILVAIALDDLASPGRAAAHAKAIRSRIDELDQAFGLRLPIYVLMTKADLLAGFTEFFDDLDRAGRDQLWGITLPMGELAPPGLLAPLLERLNLRIFSRLDAESDAERRALIAAFPAQIASAAPLVSGFVTEAFAPDAAGRAPLLRGVYLTSGTQEGTPIDRLVGGLARTFGVAGRPAAPLRPEAGRSYFLADLLRVVVFPEAPLIAFRPGAARLRMIARVAGFALCIAVVGAGSAVLLGRRADASRAVAAADAALDTQARVAATAPLDPVTDSDFTSILPLLIAATPPAPQPIHDPLGFAQDDKLAAGRQAAYRHVLEYALLPRLVWRAEEQIRGLLGSQSDALYEATRVYLMVGSAGPLDPRGLQEWFIRDWAASLPGDAGRPARDLLASSLAALLRSPLPPVALDGPLVEQARASIVRVPLAMRVYGRIKPLVDARAISGWVPAKSLGPAGVGEFVRRSGRGLEVGVGGFYTVEGLRSGLLPELPRAVREASAESWVTGAAVDPNGAQAATLEGEVLRLYATDYAAAWDDVLNDLDLKPMRSLTQASQDLFILASAGSPLRALLAAASAELAPAEKLPPNSTARERLAVVDERFRPLRALFGTGGAAPIDQILRNLGDLQQQLAKQAASTTRPPPPAPGDDPALALRSEALRQPQPLSRWLAGLATGAAALRDGGPRGAMQAAWNGGAGAGAQCAAVVNGRYPFAPAAVAEVGLEEFTALFGPGGAIDAFFNAQLKPYVDMAARPWRLQMVEGQSAPITPADLAQFQLAATIRDLFFQAGGKQPLARFDVVPAAADGQSVRLELGGVQVGASRDAPARAAAMSWPTRPPAGPVRLTVEGGSAPAAIEADGAWGLFRLLGRARVVQSGPRGGFVFDVGGHSVRLDLRAVQNPFTPSLLSGFHCPVVQ